MRATIACNCHEFAGLDPVLSADDVDLLRTSFREAAKGRTRLATLFYDRLFEIDPEARLLFAADLEEQRAKMMSTLGSIVAQIHAFDALRPIVGDLALRHVRYGVRAEHYPPVGEALLWALRQTLDTRFTPPVEAAWTRAYEALSAAMIEAGHSLNGTNSA
jgi:hemoglobin-like flavoprotein